MFINLIIILSIDSFIASRRNTVLPETSSTTAKKSTAGSLKRGPYKTYEKQQDVAKHPRITIDDDGKEGVVIQTLYLIKQSP